MNDTLLQISVDLPLIFRVSLAISWGILWASFLQFNRHGQFLVEGRTWITVVIGIGIDMLIAYPWGGGQGDWYTVAIVITTSSIGIIFRSLYNERKREELSSRSYKLIWGLEDAIAVIGKITEALEKLLDGSELGPENMKSVSRILGMTHKLTTILHTARRGGYNQKNSKG